jgi:WD40 repeat protein
MSQEIHILGSIRDHKGSVFSVAFHPTAPILATGSQDNHTKLWRLSDDNRLSSCMGTKMHHDQIRSVAFHPTEIILATGSDDGTAKLWHLFDANIDGHTGAVLSVAFHPSGEFLATGSHDETVKLWQLSPDRSSASCVATLDGHKGAVLSVAFHPNGEFLATGSNDRTAKLWKLSSDRSSATCVATLEGREDAQGRSSGSVNSVAFHPRGRFLATGSYNRTAMLWKLTKSANTLSATLVRNFSDESSGPDTSVVSVAFDPTGHFLATGNTDNTVKLWKLSRSKVRFSASCVATLVPDKLGKKNAKASILSIAFHPTNPLLVAGSSDHSANLWDYSTMNDKHGGRGRNSITRHHEKRSSHEVKRNVVKTKRYRSK